MATETKTLKHKIGKGKKQCPNPDCSKIIGAASRECEYCHHKFKGKAGKKRTAGTEHGNGHLQSGTSRDFSAAYEIALNSGGIAKVKSAIKALKEDAIMAFVIAQGGIEKASKAIERAEKHLDKMKG